MPSMNTTLEAPAVGRRTTRSYIFRNLRLAGWVWVIFVAYGLSALLGGL
jgi:hypothetical protein